MPWSPRTSKQRPLAAHETVPLSNPVPQAYPQASPKTKDRGASALQRSLYGRDSSESGSPRQEM